MERATSSLHLLDLTQTPNKSRKRKFKRRTVESTDEEFSDNSDSEDNGQYFNANKKPFLTLLSLALRLGQDALQVPGVVIVIAVSQIQRNLIISGTCPLSKRSSYFGSFDRLKNFYWQTQWA